MKKEGIFYNIYNSHIDEYIILNGNWDVEPEDCEDEDCDEFRFPAEFSVKLNYNDKHNKLQSIAFCFKVDDFIPNQIKEGFVTYIHDGKVDNAIVFPFEDDIKAKHVFLEIVSIIDRKLLIKVSGDVYRIDDNEHISNFEFTTWVNNEISDLIKESFNELSQILPEDNINHIRKIIDDYYTLDVETFSKQYYEGKMFEDLEACIMSYFDYDFLGKVILNYLIKIKFAISKDTLHLNQVSYDKDHLKVMRIRAKNSNSFYMYVTNKYRFHYLFGLRVHACKKDELTTLKDNNINEIKASIFDLMQLLPDKYVGYPIKMIEEYFEIEKEEFCIKYTCNVFFNKLETYTKIYHSSNFLGIVIIEYLLSIGFIVYDETYNKTQQLPEKFKYENSKLVSIDLNGSYLFYAYVPSTYYFNTFFNLTISDCDINEINAVIPTTPVETASDSEIASKTTLISNQEIKHPRESLDIKPKKSKAVKAFIISVALLLSVSIRYLVRNDVFQKEEETVQISSEVQQQIIEDSIQETQDTKPTLDSSSDMMLQVASKYYFDANKEYLNGYTIDDATNPEHLILYDANKNIVYDDVKALYYSSSSIIGISRENQKLILDTASGNVLLEVENLQSVHVYDGASYTKNGLAYQVSNDQPWILISNGTEYKEIVLAGEKLDYLTTIDVTVVPPVEK